MRRTTISSILLSSSAFVLFSGAAFAEENTSQPASESDKSAAGAEIVVTGQGHSAEVQNAPVSITSLSATDIAKKNLVEPGDLARAVPGLTVSEIGTTRNSARYTLRGQNQETGADPSVVTYFGGVATSSPGPGFLFDLAGVDVYKGPQGTSFGRGVTGGAVVLMPNEPGQTYGGYLEASGGSYDFRRIQGALDVPILGDALLARFAIDLNDRHGYTRDITSDKWLDGRKYGAYRAFIVAHPFAGLTNKTIFNFAYGKSTEAGSAIVAVAPNGLSATRYPAVVAALAEQQARGPRAVAHNVVGAFSSFRSLSVSNQTQYDVTSHIALENIFGYNDNRVANIDDTDGSPYPLLAYLPNGHVASYPEPESPFKSFSDEVRLKGTGLLNGKFDWATGYFYEHKWPASWDQQDLTNTMGSLSFSQALKQATTNALYAHASYALTRTLKVNGGIRQTWDKRAQTTTSYRLATPCAPGVQPSGAICGLSQKASFSGTTWDVSLQFSPDQQTMAYASVRRGYKAGGFNTNGPSASYLIYNPEHVTSYELGAKRTFALRGATGHVNLELYDAEFTGKQTSGTLVVNALNYSLITNAGSGHVRGLDFDADIRLFDRLNLNVLYSHTAGKTDSLVFNGLTQAGAPMAGISKDKVSATAEVDLMRSDSKGTISASGTYSYQSSFLGATSLAAVQASDPFGGRTPGYVLVDARIDWKSVGGSNIDLSAYVTNLLDSAAIQQINNNYNGLGYDTALYVPPRMIAGSVRFHF